MNKLPESRREAMLHTIGKIESNGNYNVVVGGKEYPLTKMTVGEVLALQSTMKGNTAAGKYQIKKETLESLVYKPGSKKLRNPKDFNLDTKFDEAGQDWAANALLDRRGFADMEAGKLSPDELAFNLSQEWASLPDPTKGDRESHYGGDGVHDRPTQVGAGQVLKILSAVETNGKPRSKPDPVADGGVPRQEPIQGGSGGPENGQDPLVGGGVNSQRPEWQGGQGLLRSPNTGHGTRHPLGQALRTSR